MKKNSIIMTLLTLVIAFLVQGCAEADPEFVHTKNTISQMICRQTHGGYEAKGQILEYNKDGVLVEGEFIQEDVEGGYGIILFQIPKSMEKDIDLTRVYLIATVTYDEAITPTLSGRHDISGEGKIVTVKSGIGTIRSYRVRGYYE